MSSHEHTSPAGNPPARIFHEVSGHGAVQPLRLLLFVTMLAVPPHAVFAQNKAFPDLPAEFKSLRAARGHFDGGQWNDAVDRWGGRKQIIMQSLANRLTQSGANCGAVTATLGKPDLIAGPDDDLFEQLASATQTPPYRILIWFWRGKHDFLYFRCFDPEPATASWWHAQEQ